MSAPEPMPSVRRRPIPGMTANPPRQRRARAVPQTPRRARRHTRRSPKTAEPELTHQHGAPALSGDEHAGPPASLPRTADAGPARRPAADYAATRLANFRIPVDLHDRYRRSGP